MATNYKVGDKIVLFRGHQEAIIRYVGKTEFAPTKTSYGLELCDTARGDHNGTVNGKKYFKCPKNKGKFVFEKDIKFKIKAIKKHQRVSSKKLGPRDIGRNDTYNSNTKATKKSKASTKKTKKKKKKKKAKSKHDQIASRSNNEVSDSDSYKSGYSGASGHSAVDEDEQDEQEPNGNYRNHTAQQDSDDAHELEDAEDNREDSGEYEEDIDDNTLTGKVMMMMKQREEERKEKEEEDTTVMVAMSRKQMNKNDNKLFDEPKEEESHKEEEAAEEEEAYNSVDDDPDSNEEETKDEGTEEIDDDLPEVLKQKSVKSEFKNYAARRGSVHDKVATEGRDSTATAHKQTDSVSQSAPVAEAKALTGKTQNVDEIPSPNATQKGCCVVL